MAGSIRGTANRVNTPKVAARRSGLLGEPPVGAVVKVGEVGAIADHHPEPPFHGRVIGGSELLEAAVVQLVSPRRGKST